MLNALGSNPSDIRHDVDDPGQLFEAGKTDLYLPSPAPLAKRNFCLEMTLQLFNQVG
jgi:hypothetical protein